MENFHDRNELVISDTRTDKKKIKVLHVIPFLSPIYGGSAKAAADIVVNLVNEGINVRIIYFGNNSDLQFPYLEKLRLEKKVSILQIPIKYTFSRYFLCLPAIQYLMRETYDILHIHNSRHFLADIGPIITEIKKKKVVLSPNGTLSPIFYKDGAVGKMKSLFDKTIGVILRKLVDVYIPNTVIEGTELYRKHHIPKEKMVIIPHNITPFVKSQHPVRDDILTTYGLNDNPYLLFFGRISKQKGIQHLLEAFGIINESMSDIRLVIAGPDGGYKQPLVALSEKLKVKQNVVFTGFLTPETGLTALIKGAELVINPSSYESFGLSVAESAFLGKPIIQAVDTSVGKQLRMPFLIHGINGYFVPFGNPVALANAILELLKDPGKRALFSAHSIEMCRNYPSAKSISARYARIYKQLLRYGRVLGKREGPRSIITERFYTSSQYHDRNPSWDIEHSPWKANLIATMIKRHSIKPRTIGEIGCGVGEILNQLYNIIDDESVYLTGYDISPIAIERCKKKERDRLHYILGGISDLKQDEYDLILAIDVIEHVDDYIGFLRNIRGKGRYKIFHIPLDISVGSVLLSKPLLNTREKVGHLHYFTKETALATLKDCGYRILDQFLTTGAFEFAKTSRSSSLLMPIRMILDLLDRNMAARIMGGYSLMVLAV